MTLERRPTRLGTAHACLPSATPGRVWLAGTDCDRAAMVGVREVTVGGRVTQESARRVPGSWLPAAVRGGLVVQRERTFAVWDPRTGRRGPRCPARAPGHYPELSWAASSGWLFARWPSGRRAAPAASSPADPPRPWTFVQV